MGEVLKKLVLGAAALALVVIIYGYWDKSRTYIADDIKAVAKVAYRDDHSNLLKVVIRFTKDDDNVGVQSVNYKANLYISGKIADAISGSCIENDSNSWLAQCVIDIDIPGPAVRPEQPELREGSTKEERMAWIFWGPLDNYELRDEEIVVWKSYRPLRYIQWIDRGIDAVLYPFTR